MRPGYESCTGCHVCALPCPVFRQSRDLTLTLHGRARALLAGATPREVAPSTLACVLCGACEPVCPEDIDTVGLTLDLRRALAAQDENPIASTLRAQFPTWIEAPASAVAQPRPTQSRPVMLLASTRLQAEPDLTSRVVEALGGAGQVMMAADAGDDLANRIEAGLEIPERRRLDFLAGLPSRGLVVTLEGLLLRSLAAWRPGLDTRSLGEALLRRPAVVRALGPDDLLIIDSRGFHADHARLVTFYDDLRARTGCDTNLDLQRVAIPTGAVSLQARLGIGDHDIGAQIAWIMEGRSIRRVVVEAVEDLAAFRRHIDTPVCHLAELTTEAGR
jgi:ferredoxin